jgi:hypothetical protein
MPSSAAGLAGTIPLKINTDCHHFQGRTLVALM